MTKQLVQQMNVSESSSVLTLANSLHKYPDGCKFGHHLNRKDLHEASIHLRTILHLF